MKKQFTIKDFISYNNPCFNCGGTLTIRVGSWDLQSPLPAIYINCNISANQTEIDLHITYSQTLKLIINHTTNKIKTSSLRALTKYLEIHKIFLSSICKCCYASIESNYLDFNLEKGFIKPFAISRESLPLNEGENTFLISSIAINEETILTTYRKDLMAQTSQFKIKLTFLYNFKTKEKIINKIKTYILFS